MTTLAQHLEDSRIQAKGSRTRKSAAKKEAAERKAAEEQAVLEMLEACRVEKVEQLWNIFAHGLRMRLLEFKIRASIEFRKLHEDMWAGLARRLVQRHEQIILAEATSPPPTPLPPAYIQGLHG